MALLMKDGDYAVRDGGLAATEAGESMINEVLFRLVARRGSFPFLPELGSGLYRLREEKPGDWPTLARQYAAQALEGLEGLSVTGAEVRQEGDRLWVAVELSWNGAPLNVECEA